jgi:plasmid stability protein
MAVNLSIKNVPDTLVERLRERALRHHRSLQGELVSILEEVLASRRLTIEEVHRRVSDTGLLTEAEAVDMVREDRDGR